MKRKSLSSPPNSTSMPETKNSMMDDFRISPEKRICPSYDYLSIAAYQVAAPNKMGFRVVDNCAEEHIM